MITADIRLLVPVHNSNQHEYELELVTELIDSTSRSNDDGSFILDSVSNTSSMIMLTGFSFYQPETSPHMGLSSQELASNIVWFHSPKEMVVLKRHISREWVRWSVAYKGIISWQRCSDGNTITNQPPMNTSVCASSS